MKLRVRGQIFFGVVIAIYSSPATNAGFLSPSSDLYFTAANWTLTTNGGDGSGTITSDAMTLISNDAEGVNKYVQYSILIPSDVENLSFSYQWSTLDGWIYDQPSYFVGSTQTMICPESDLSCSGTVSNLDLSTQVGQQFIFQQISSDGCCERATLVISEINGVITQPTPAPAPAPVNVRQTSNLSFAQSLHASDTLSDPDGELRKTVDQIMLKHGSLIK